jgi:hypothetical protein
MQEGWREEDDVEDADLMISHVFVIGTGRRTRSIYILIYTI